MKIEKKKEKKEEENLEKGEKVNASSLLI